MARVIPDGLTVSLFREIWLQKIDVGLTGHELLPRKTSSHALLLSRFIEKGGGGFHLQSQKEDDGHLQYNVSLNPTFHIITSNVVQYGKRV